MPKLPVVSGKEAVKAFSKIGYVPYHQTGSHIILRTPINRIEDSLCQITKKYQKACCMT